MCRPAAAAFSVAVRRTGDTAHSEGADVTFSSSTAAMPAECVIQPGIVW